MQFRPLPCKLFQQQPLREEISTIGISILVKGLELPLHLWLIDFILHAYFSLSLSLSLSLYHTPFLSLAFFYLSHSLPSSGLN